MVGSPIGRMAGGSFRQGFLVTKKSNAHRNQCSSVDGSLIEVSWIGVWGVQMTSILSIVRLVTTAITSCSMTAMVANAVDNLSSSLFSGRDLFHETLNACSCCIWESNLVMVRKARIFLGIPPCVEVGRGMPGVSGDQSLFLGILCVVCWACTSLRGLVSLLFL